MIFNNQLISINKNDNKGAQTEKIFDYEILRLGVTIEKWRFGQYIR